MTKEDQILETLKEQAKTLKEHTKILNEHTDKLSNHDKRLDNMDETIKDIKRSLIIIEDAVTNKIPAFFDGHSSHQEHLEKNDKEIEELQMVSENHSLRLIMLEDTSKQHSQQLKNL